MMLACRQNFFCNTWLKAAGSRGLLPVRAWYKGFSVLFSYLINEPVYLYDLCLIRFKVGRLFLTLNLMISVMESPLALLEVQIGCPADLSTPAGLRPTSDSNPCCRRERV